MLRQLAYALPQIPGFDSLRPKTYAAWPVWEGSTTGEIQWPKVVKQAVIDWYHKARDWNARKETIRRYGGTLGSSAIRVYECLIFDFQNWRTGQLDPSYIGIAKKVGLCRSTVAKALALLRRLGLIHWVRRSAHHWRNGKFELKQITNAYVLLPPTQWRGVDLPPAPPSPEPGTWGDHPPLPDVTTQAIEERQQGGSMVTAIKILETDETDGVAQSLARLGRTMLAAEAEAKPGET
jgi:Helix-turn-helix domain